MFWDCPTVTGFGEEVVVIINQAMDRALNCSLWDCMLGMFPRPGPKKATNRFIDLALIVATRQITHQWKSKNGPRCEPWKAELKKWVGAESTALHREAVKGIRSLICPVRGIVY